MTAPTPLPLPGIASLIDRYQGFLIDLWGCVHNGEALYPGVVDCLARMRAAGKQIGLLSNAPRRPRGVILRLRELGLEPDAYDFLMTSGEAARIALTDPPDEWHRRLGERCYHLGPERDRDVFLDHRRLVETTDPDAADFILNTGPLDFDHPADAYDGLLDRWAARSVPMVCANPDLVVVVGPRLVLCAGTLAERYQARGGQVRHHGKPHAPIYAQCLAQMSLAPAAVLAIGDGLHTDIDGGAAAGMDTALIAGGIHRAALAIGWGDLPPLDRLAPLIGPDGATPTWILPSLRW